LRNSHQAVDKREAPDSPGALFVAGDFVGRVIERIRLKVPLEKVARMRVAQEPGSRS
jgi:hypothetical protein